jgi:hypothetical protein
MEKIHVDYNLKGGLSQLNSLWAKLTRKRRIPLYATRGHPSNAQLNVAMDSTSTRTSKIL